MLLVSLPKVNMIFHIMQNAFEFLGVSLDIQIVVFAVPRVIFIGAVRILVSFDEYFVVKDGMFWGIFK